jgi:hypothetical protein
VLDVHRAGQHDRGDEVVGRRSLGLDDEVDPHHVACEALVRAEVVRIADPRDRPRRSELTGSERGDDVDLVALGHRAQQIGVLHADLGQQLRRRPVAEHHHRVELALHRLDPRRIAVHDGHLVALCAQCPGHVLPDLADADHDRSHATIVHRQGGWPRARALRVARRSR